ncbi:MAG: GRAS family protein [Spirochaetes bacterium]|nr:GRAS family protein [Spirochaetota bacterium]
MDSHKDYNDLISIGRSIINKNYSQARAGLAELLMPEITLDNSNKVLLKGIIAESLMMRVSDTLEVRKKIYLEDFDVSQIDMFSVMGQAYPQIFASHDIANQFLKSAIENREEITILDIGIGQCLQLKKLLKEINSTENLLRINIIGLDPDQKNLETAADALNSIQAELKFDLNYFPVLNFLEKLKAKDYQLIKNLAGENLMINASYALHHISNPRKDREIRTEVLARLAALNPLIFTLIEPHSNHHTDNLVTRIRDCTSHFDTVFNLIDKSAVDDRIKLHIKENFFGREIRDIFGVNDQIRTERHELTENWIIRLVEAGFRPLPYRELDIDLPSYCDYVVSDGLVHLGYQHKELITVFAYK